MESKAREVDPPGNIAKPAHAVDLVKIGLDAVKTPRGTSAFKIAIQGLIDTTKYVYTEHS